MVASPTPCEAPHARPGVPRRRRASAGRSATGTIAPSAPAYTHGDTSPVRTLDSTSRAEHAGPGRVPPSPGGAADSATSPPTATSRAGPASSGQWQEVPPLRPPGIGWRSTVRCRLGCYYGSQTRRSGAGERSQGMGRAAAKPARRPPRASSANTLPVPASVRPQRFPPRSEHAVPQGPSPAPRFHGVSEPPPASLPAGACGVAACPCATGQQRVCDAAVAQATSSIHN